MSQDWKHALLGAAIGCLLATLILWPALVSLTQVWRSNQAYQFAWLVVPFIAYLLGWHHRATTLLAHPKPDLSGVAVAVIAALCWIAADLINIDAGRQFAFVLAIQGICMAALGWRSYWKLSPILWLMFLMVPSGDLFQPVLRHLTVKVIELVALAFQLPHQVNGFQIRIGDNDYIVLKECAGLSYFLLGTFLGYVFGLMLYRSIYKILALTLFGAVIGVLSNALRVTGIVLIDWVQGSQMPLTAHGNVQWVALIVCLGLLFFVLSKLDVDKFPQVKGIAQTNSESRLLKWAPILGGFAVLVISAGATWLVTNTSSERGALPPNSMPQSISGWALATPEATWSVNAQDHTRSFMLNYQRDGETLGVRVIETMTAEAKLQESEIAPGKANIWHENSIEPQVGCVGAECMKLLHTAWENGKTEERQHVYSSYALGGFYTTSKFALRAAHGWARLTGGNNQPRLIGLTLDSDVPPEAVDGLAAIIRSLQSALEISDQ